MSRFDATKEEGIFWQPVLSGNQPAAFNQKRFRDKIRAWKVTQKVDFEASLVYNNLGITPMHIKKGIKLEEF